MAGSSTAKADRGRGRKSEDEILYDRELEDLPPELSWREWMLRVEAVVFASAEPVTRETLARVVGKDCSTDLLIDDLREELRDRPYELVSVAGGWQHRTRAFRRNHPRVIGADAGEEPRRSPSSRRWC